MRVILAAVLGGLVMFAWGAVSHMVLNIETTAVKPMPNEDAMISAMKGSMSEPGVYFVPGMDMAKVTTEEEQLKWAVKYREGPTAMVIYQPTGAEAFSTHRFLVQAGADIGAAFLGAIILFLAATTFARGVIISLLVGVAGWTALLLPYWNWYRFPFEFVRADLIDQAAGWFLAGLVMAFLLRVRNIAA